MYPQREVWRACVVYVPVRAQRRGPRCGWRGARCFFFATSESGTQGHRQGETEKEIRKVVRTVSGRADDILCR